MRGKNLNGSLIDISSFVNGAIDTITNDTNDTKIESIEIYYIERCDVDSSGGNDKDYDTFYHNSNIYNNRNSGNTSDRNNHRKEKKVAITVPVTSITTFMMKNHGHNKTTI